ASKVKAYYNRHFEGKKLRIESIQILLDSCQNLLVTDEELSEIYFAHASIQEYLEQLNNDPQHTQIHYRVAKIMFELTLSKPELWILFQAEPKARNILIAQ